MKKGLDKGISALVLLAFAVLWIIRLCMGTGVNPNVARGMSIAMSVMLILTYIVLLYNALGWSESWIIRLVFIVIAGFLIFFVIANWIPSLQNFIPSIGFGDFGVTQPATEVLLA